MAIEAGQRGVVNDVPCLCGGWASVSGLATSPSSGASLLWVVLSNGNGIDSMFRTVVGNNEHFLPRKHGIFTSRSLHHVPAPSQHSREIRWVDLFQCFLDTPPLSPSVWPEFLIPNYRDRKHNPAHDSGLSDTRWGNVPPKHQLFCES